VVLIPVFMVFHYFLGTSVLWHTLSCYFIVKILFISLDVKCITSYLKNLLMVNLNIEVNFYYSHERINDLALKYSLKPIFSASHIFADCFSKKSGSPKKKFSYIFYSA